MGRATGGSLRGERQVGSAGRALFGQTPRTFGLTAQAVSERAFPADGPAPILK
jgi:hypothetical protein